MTHVFDYAGCADGWVEFDGSCYYVDDTPTLKWDDARSACQDLGGDLPIIRSEEENEFIFDLIKKQTIDKRTEQFIG